MHSIQFIEPQITNGSNCNYTMYLDSHLPYLPMFQINHGNSMRTIPMLSTVNICFYYINYVLSCGFIFFEFVKKLTFTKTFHVS